MGATARELLIELDSVYAQEQPVDDEDMMARLAKHREIVEGTWRLGKRALNVDLGQKEEGRAG